MSMWYTHCELVLTLSLQVFFKVPFLGFFSLIQREDEVWPGDTQLMLLPELSSVCIPIFRSVAPWVCLAKVPFLALSIQDGVWLYRYA